MQTSEIQFKVIHICFLPTLFSGTGSRRPSDVWTHNPPSISLFTFSNNCSKCPSPHSTVKRKSSH